MRTNSFLMILFENLDFIYSIVKVSSMIATGAFGALALLTKYKNDKNQITKWGKIALGGIVLSLAASLSLYAVETSRAKAAAERAKNEALATTQKLENLIASAEVTAKRQGENLQLAEKIKRDLGTSLDKQESVLTGNQQILQGVTETVDEQKRQVEKLVRLDLARSPLTGLVISIPIKNLYVNERLLQLFLKQLWVEYDRSEHPKLPCLESVSNSSVCRVLPSRYRSCFELKTISAFCGFEMETQKDRVFLGVYDRRSHNKLGGTEIDKYDWGSFKSLASDLLRYLQLFDESERPIFSIDKDAKVSGLTLTRAGLEVRLEDPDLHLDQLYNARVRFKFDGTSFDAEDLTKINLRSVDPRVALDQMFHLKWEKNPDKRTLHPSEFGYSGWGYQWFSETFILKTRFRTL